MEAFRTHRGIVAPLDRQNVDTDQIIPKQFLKRIERTGYGEFLFFDWRFDGAGNRKSDFVFNDPKYSNASILAAGRNFGCGSSREHAAWALLNYGIRTILAPSFADIFLSNAAKNGLLTIALPEDTLERIMRSSQQGSYELTIDLERLRISDDSGWAVPFQIDEFRRKCLLEGADDISLTLRHEPEISRFEASRRG